jgi:hypothetical protein
LFSGVEQQINTTAGFERYACQEVTAYDGSIGSCGVERGGC